MLKEKEKKKHKNLLINENALSSASEGLSPRKPKIPKKHTNKKQVQKTLFQHVINQQDQDDEINQILNQLHNSSSSSSTTKKEKYISVDDVLNIISINNFE